MESSQIMMGLSGFLLDVWRCVFCWALDWFATRSSFTAFDFCSKWLIAHRSIPVLEMCVMTEYCEIIMDLACVAMNISYHPWLVKADCPKNWTQIFTAQYGMRVTIRLPFYLVVAWVSWGVFTSYYPWWYTVNGFLLVQRSLRIWWCSQPTPEPNRDPHSLAQHLNHYLPKKCSTFSVS